MAGCRGQRAHDGSRHGGHCRNGDHNRNLALRESAAAQSHALAIRGDRALEQGHRVCQLVGLLGADEIATLLQHRTEVERGMWLAALVRCPVASLGIVEIAACLQHDPQVEGGTGMSPRISLSICELRGRDVAALLEQQPELEPFDGFPEPLQRFVSAPCHLLRTVSSFQRRHYAGKLNGRR
jgi:hypothetical protein